MKRALRSTDNLRRAWGKGWHNKHTYELYLGLRSSCVYTCTYMCMVLVLLVHACMCPAALLCAFAASHSKCFSTAPGPSLNVYTYLWVSSKKLWH